MLETISNRRAIASRMDHQDIDAGGVQHSDNWGLVFNPDYVVAVVSSADLSRPELLPADALFDRR
jgi:hypothetical protein